LPKNFNILTTRPSNKFKPNILVDIVELTIETWLETDKKKECNFFKYTRKVFKRKQVKRLDKNFLNSGKDRITYSLGGLNEDANLGVITENVTPPNWETAEPLNPTESVNLLIEKNFSTVGIDWSNANEDNKRRLEYQCNTLINNDEGNRLAEFLGKTQLQSYYAREISLPLADSDEFLTDSTPFNRAYVNNGSYVLSGESIVILPNEAELAFIGLFEKALSSPVPDRLELAKPDPPELPNEVSTFPTRSPINFTVDIQWIITSEVFGEFRLPSLGNVVVTNDNISVIDGDVETTSGYNFKGIVTFEDRVVINENNIVTSFTSFPDSYFNSILTMDNEETTMDDKVLTMV
jgi:hypothetical protein